MHLRKTLLAISIAAAAQYVAAETVVLDNNSFETSGQYHTGLQIKGTYIGADDAIELEGASVSNGLVNNATINIDAPTTPDSSNSVNYPAGIDIDRDSSGSPTTISGGFVNNGDIAVKGLEATAILVDSARISGDFINNAKLSAFDPTTRTGAQNDLQGAKGIDFGNVTLTGDIRNGGRIEAIGDDATALDVYLSTIQGPTGIINLSSGEIYAKGRNADGISLENTKLAGGIVNDGSILTEGLTAVEILAAGESLNGYQDQANGIDFDSGGSLDRLVNTGSIKATGHNANAILVDGSTFGYGIVNTGIIDGEGTGIRVENFQINPNTVDGDYVQGEGAGNGYFRIQQNAGVIRGQKNAILGNEFTDLIWNGGEIDGKIHGLSEVKVTGRSGVANFGGSVIEVNEEVTIENGAQLNFNAPHSVIERSTTAQVWGQGERGGNLVVEQGGTLGLSLSSATDASRPVLLVEGEASFAKDSVVMLNASADQFTANGKTYRLIQAGSLVDNGLILNSSSALLSVTNKAVTSTSLGADVSRLEVTPANPVPTEPAPEKPADPSPTKPADPAPTKPVEPAPSKPSDPTDGTVVVAPNDEKTNAAIIAQGGGSRNAQAAGSRFVSVIGNLQANDPVALAMINAGTDTNAIARIAAQLAPEVNGGSTQAAMGGQSMISSAIGGRMGAARSGMSSGEGFDEVGGWIQVLSSDANQDMRDGIEGYSSNSKGLLFGADGKLNEQTTLGLSYSFINSDVKSDLGNKTDVDTHALTAYGSWTQNALFVDGSLTYGLSKNDAERFIAGTKSTANYDSKLFGLNVMSGYAFDLGNNLVVEPRVAGRYSKVITEKYNEKGSSGSLSIQNDQRFEVGELGAGVRLAGQFDVAGGLLTPEAKVMAYHDFIGDQAKTEAAFLAGGQSFNTFGASTARDTYEFGLGASYRRDQVTFTVGYDRQMKSGFDADTFSAKVRYDF